MTPQQLQQELSAIGISTRAFAEAVGKTKRTVERYLAGTQAIPKWVPHSVEHMKRKVRGK